MGGSVYVCSLGISQTCGGGEGLKPKRDTNRMPGVTIVAAEIKTCLREKRALCLCWCACELERKQRMAPKKVEEYRFTLCEIVGLLMDFLH